MKSAALLSALAVACSAPAIDWASQPVVANQTVMLLGGAFTSTSDITLASSYGQQKMQAHQPSSGSIKFQIPLDLPQEQWGVSVDGSEPYTLNSPQPWWASGDLRLHATPGGFVRVFGSCVYFPSRALKSAKKDFDAATVALTDALNTFSTSKISPASIVNMAQQAEAARKIFISASAASASMLRLIPKPSRAGNAAGASASVLVYSDPHNSIAWSGWFTLPSSILPGEYTVEVANHLNLSNFVALGDFGSYISPEMPKQTTITVLSQNQVEVRQPWKKQPKEGGGSIAAAKTKAAKIFNVADFGPHGLPGCGPGWDPDMLCPMDPATGERFKPQNYWVNASMAIEKAIAAAGIAGGGTVYFPRGTYFVNSTHGFEIPWGVKLQGEGKDLVEIIFQEIYGVCSQATGCAIKPDGEGSGPRGYFRSPSTGTGGWAVSDLTIYVTAWHNAMFHVSDTTVGFEMTRVRVTANSFFGGSGPGKGRSPAANVSWGMQDPGDLLVILGTDYLVEDCDLYCDGNVITSTTRSASCKAQQGNRTGMAHCHGSAWGIIRNNRIFNGGSSHFMPQWKQIIFEGNEITGISPMSGGQSFGTGPGGGRAHNLYHAKNTIKFVWSNDREIVTFDDAGSAYLGRVGKVSEDGLVLTLATDARTIFFQRRVERLGRCCGQCSQRDWDWYLEAGCCAWHRCRRTRRRVHESEQPHLEDRSKVSVLSH
jgi:hypothetical protein